MEKPDARKLSQDIQYALRKQIVRLRKQGRSNKEVAQIVGATERHTSKIWQKYLREGSFAIKLGQRGRRHGGSRKLTSEQELEVTSYSPELNPDEYLNGNLKNKIRSGIPARNEKDIVSKTRSFMKTLQKRPQHAKKYFKHPAVAYAA